MNMYELDTRESIDSRRYNIYFIRYMRNTDFFNVFKKIMVIYH